MRDCQLIVLQSIMFALLLKNFALELQKFDMVRHVVKVDRCRACFEEVNALHLNLGVLILLFRQGGLSTERYLRRLRCIVRKAINAIALVFGGFVLLLYDNFLEVTWQLVLRLNHFLESLCSVHNCKFNRVEHCF